MHWILLILAGVFEATRAIAKYSNVFTATLLIVMMHNRFIRFVEFKLAYFFFDYMFNT